jgi:hypothetical protein
LFSQIRAEGHSALGPYDVQRVENDTARFSIIFPGEPFHADKRRPEAELFKREIIYQKDNINNQITYYAVANILHKEKYPADPQEFLKIKADKYHEVWGGEPLRNEMIKYGSIRGREIENKLNDRFNMRVRMFYRDSIYYEFTLVGPPDSINAAPGNKFYESLEFME